MGSLGEEDLEKLVLDYIESSPITISDHMDNKSSSALINLQEILGEKREEEKEMEEKIESFMMINSLSYEGDDEKRDVMNKIVSELRSDGYDASFSKTSWDSSFDHREGCRVFRCTRTYEYIDVMVKGDGDGDDLSKLRRVIVDLDFKCQFELAKQTKAYKDMTELLPTVFVATEERLRRVVSLVCGEMKKSMKKEGMSRPPWRTSRYMQSKWLPENRRRVSRCKKGSWSWSAFDDGGGEAARSWSVNGSNSKTKCCFPIF
ncbi:hypothetical protein CARUB_v10020822mg [Capsella rubella]|uniref:DUF506 domain-containing protein n=1 Tax=Capsella rubella TaxID=81985 RepID=R0IFR2_9BRAS|nr:uncharacterized protein LOC17895456 [Capsella rubella]EOA35608.1 hypothetical protein CARUB_v10020822mg [Capsella rubella]